MRSESHEAKDQPEGPAAETNQESMKMSLLLKIVRQEVRRTLKPTGLIGKRGPARNVPVLIERQFVKNRPAGVRAVTLALGMSE